MLRESVESRLLDCKNADLATSARVLDMKRWPECMHSQLTFGETEVATMSITVQLNEENAICESREYLTEMVAPEKLKHLKKTMSMIPVSSSECERGFSQMNLIVSPPEHT
jgi:hypothetical protein